ncbi:MAG: glycosyltransferase family 4 protein [Candidatus Nealsonbacteria bacterium]|nr:glycosyltransferase family 4 protein [Candidatus Nealsonbacteria bacterium]
MASEFKKTKIFLITSHFPPKKGGVETSSVQYLDFIEKCKKLKAVVLTYENRYKGQFEDYWQNSKVIRIKVPIDILKFMIEAKSVCTLDGFFKKTFFVFLHTYYLLKGAFLNWKELKDADIIFANGAIVESIPAYFLSLVSKKKLVIRWHVDIKNSLINFFMRSVLRLCFRKAIKIGVNAKNIKKEVMEISNISNEDKIFVGVQSVDTKIFYLASVKIARERLNLPDDKFIVLFTAVLNRIKFCDLFIEVAYRVIADDKEFFFVFVGEGPLEDKIIKLEKLFPKNIRFTQKFVSQEILSHYINASNIVVGCVDTFYPARLVLESLACGVPLLIPNVSGSSYLRGENCKPKFEIPLPHIFMVNPLSSDLSFFLLHNKLRLQNFRSQKDIIKMAREFIVENHEISKVIKNEIEEFI